MIEIWSSHRQKKIINTINKKYNNYIFSLNFPIHTSFLYKCMSSPYAQATLLVVNKTTH